MIRINLLPPELRAKEGVKLPREFYIVAISMLSFLIILHAATGMIIKWKMKHKVGLMQMWTELAPVKKKVNIVKQELSDLSQRVGGIDQLVVKRFLWSEKLNQLSDLIAPGIWLSELSLTPALPARGLPASLNLKGSVISQYGEEMAIVGKFMANLKKHKGFSEDFANIELKLIQRREIKDAEIVDFVLICYFKEGIL